MLRGVNALCRRFGVPASEIPADIAPLSGAYLGDLCRLAEADLLAREKAKEDADR